MLEQALLIVLLFLPLAGGILVASMGPGRAGQVRWTSAAVSVITLALALFLAVRFMQTERTPVPTPGSNLKAPVLTFQPEFVPGSDQTSKVGPHATGWELIPLGQGAIQFYIGLDGLNVWLVVLTAVLMLPCVLISWEHVSERVHEFYAWLLILQTTMMGVFLAFDIILFYVFFELTLIPLFFLIGIWGGPERRYAARKFFIYTLAGSLITLLGALAVVFLCHEHTGVLTFSIPQLIETMHGPRLLGNPDAEFQAWLRGAQTWIFLALMVGFMIKVPLFPFHTWLPLAHVEAPTAGSVDLAGVLLKIGAYGFLRLCLPLAPDAAWTLGLPVIAFLACIGIVYGALCAYAQDDMKRMIAYSSVSHLGLCMLGMFALNVPGISGSIVQMINHGLSTALLFLMVGMFYERYHTRMIAEYGGMASRFPLLGLFFVFTVLSSVGLPGLNGFIGEALCLMGIYDHEWTRGGFPILTLVGVSGIILGAWYLFTLTRAILFGPVREPEHDAHHPLKDMKPREWLIVAPLGALCLLLGLYPQPVIKTMEPDVHRVVDIAARAKLRVDPPAPPPSKGPGMKGPPGMKGKMPKKNLPAGD